MTLGKRIKRFRGKVKDFFKQPGSTSSAATSTSSLPNAQTISADINPVPGSSVKATRTTVNTPDPQPGAQSPLHSLVSTAPPVENQVGQTQSEQLVPQAQTVSPSVDPVADPADNNESGSVEILGPAPGAASSLPSPSINPSAARLIVAQEESKMNQDTAQPDSNLPDQRDASSAADLATGSITTTPTIDPTSHPKTPTPENAQARTWKCLTGFRGVLDRVSGGFGPLKPVLDGLHDVIGAYEDAAEARQEYTALRSDLEALFTVLSEHFSGDVPPTMTAGMNNLCSAIEAELDMISSKQEQGAGRRYLEAKKDIQDVMECYRRIQGHLERLKLNSDLNMWKVVDRIAAESKMNSLAPSKAARYNSAESANIGRRECTPETRKQVLAGLSQWRHDKRQDNMYWLNGMAGTGKTTIANSLCAMLDKSHELGASFFCSRVLPECRNVNLILPTIAYQLARFSRPFYHALSRALEDDPDLHTKVLSSQFAGLIMDPLRQAAPALPMDLVVVIDALDECEDSQGVSQLLEILARHAADLHIKLFVSSRPEPQIRQKIGGTKSQLILHELEDSIVQEDIRLYLNTELRGLLPSVSDDDLTTLVKRAGVLFIYAATVVRYIQAAKSDPLRRNRLKGILDVSDSGYANKNKEIDALYTAVLTCAFDNPDLEEPEKAIMKLVLDTVVCTQEPLTTAGLAGILDIKEESLIQAALEPLWSVIHISGGDGGVTTLHASFPDYMLDPMRSKTHGCRKHKHHGRLAKLCFDRIRKNKPQFNVCGLESSSLFDKDVNDIEDRVRRAIPPDLLYACNYWKVHMELEDHADGCANQLQEFLSERLLLWMEVLNLTNKISNGVSMLAAAQAWCQVSGVSQDTKDLIHDAWRFATTFATHDVVQSTPHLYISMLPSWPSPGTLANCYIPRARRLSSVRGTGMSRRQLALLSALSVSSGVRVVTFSSDGMRIVSGCDDGKIRLWDATSGKPVMDPLEGHTSSVNSVAFSLDGTRIVSGSYDNTIRLWDATSGKPAMDPLEGHTSLVLSVAFSPDGTRIVSGSSDNTIRLWDTTSGKPVMSPLEGHTSSVLSVAFSPDCTRIVSGSYDNTIRLWDATSGKPAMDPLEGHTSSV